MNITFLLLQLYNCYGLNRYPLVDLKIHIFPVLSNSDGHFGVNYQSKFHSILIVYIIVAALIKIYINKPYFQTFLLQAIKKRLKFLAINDSFDQNSTQNIKKRHKT